VTLRVCVCVSVCRRCNWKTARAINTKLGRHTVRGTRSACIDFEVERSKVKVTRLSNTFPVLPEWVCMRVDKTNVGLVTLKE